MIVTHPQHISEMVLDINLASHHATISSLKKINENVIKRNSVMGPLVRIELATKVLEDQLTYRRFTPSSRVY